MLGGSEPEESEPESAYISRSSISSTSKRPLLPRDTFVNLTFVRLGMPHGKKQEEIRHLDSRVKSGKGFKINTHTVINASKNGKIAKAESFEFPCPHCGGKIALKVDVNERSSAVWFTLPVD